jgi:acyl dehydratase
MKREGLMLGKYFEELEIGKIFFHMPRKTVTENDNLLFPTVNIQQVNLDAECVKKSRHGKILVVSVCTLSTAINLSVGDTTLTTTLDNIEFDKTSFPNPIFIGNIISSFVSAIAPT